MATAEMLLTLEEYLQLPDNGRKTELVRGRVVEMNQPTPWHGYVCSKIDRLVGNFAEDNDLGRTMSNDSAVITERDPGSVRGPDVCYYSFTRLPKGPMPKTYLDVTPDLVFEVRSPGQSLVALQAKAVEFLQAGVSVVCIVDPGKLRVTIFENEEEPRVLSIDDTLTLPAVLPGFEVPVARLFE